MKGRLKEQIIEIRTKYLVRSPGQAADKFEELSVQEEFLAILSLEYLNAISPLTYFEKFEITLLILTDLRYKDASVLISQEIFKALCQILKEFASTKEELSHIAMKYWTKIHPELLYTYCKDLNITLPSEEILCYSAYLILLKQYSKASILANDFGLLVRYIQKTLQELYNIFDCLIDTGEIELLKKLIRNDKDLLPLAIESFVEKDLLKDAEKIIKSHGYAPALFPALIVKKLERSIKYLVKSRSISMLHLIDHTKSNNLALSTLIQILVADQSPENWMVFLASHLLNSYPHLKSHLSPFLPPSLPPPGFTFTPPPDEFQPSDPKFYHLPQSCLVYFIDSPTAVSAMDFEDVQVVGLDSEWKIDIGSFEYPQVSILQIGCFSRVYVIDLPVCSEFKEFDDVLYDLFQDPQVTKLGISFEGDMTRLKKSYPKMVSFQLSIKGYIDLVQVFAGNNKYYPGGLAGLTRIVMDTQLCKLEQKSNWESRPLRLAQFHYAACDVHICLCIYQRMIELGVDFEIRDTQGIGKAKKEQGSGACEYCSSKTHTSRECPQETRCQICGRLNHTPENCPCIVKYC